jgi:hypothetical protein
MPRLTVFSRVSEKRQQGVNIGRLDLGNRKGFIAAAFAKNRQQQNKRLQNKQ